MAMCTTTARALAMVCPVSEPTADGPARVYWNACKLFATKPVLQRALISCIGPTQWMNTLCAVHAVLLLLVRMPWAADGFLSFDGRDDIDDRLQTVSSISMGAADKAVAFTISMAEDLQDRFRELCPLEFDDVEEPPFEDGGGRGMVWGTPHQNSDSGNENNNYSF